MYILGIYTLSNPLSLKNTALGTRDFHLANGFVLRCRPQGDRSSAEGRSHERRSYEKKNFRARHYKDLTEAGNCALKVSGTRGIKIHC